LFLEGGVAVAHNSPVPPDRSAARFVAESKRLTRIAKMAVESIGANWE
jgi:hypothetical protein